MTICGVQQKFHHLDAHFWFLFTDFAQKFHGVHVGKFLCRPEVNRLRKSCNQQIPTGPLVFVEVPPAYHILQLTPGKLWGVSSSEVSVTVMVVRECYDRWCRLQGEVESYYHDKPRERKKLSQEKEFRQIKNAVIREAERIRLGEITFEDADLSENDEPGQFWGESYACWELRQIIRDERLSLEERDGAVEELEQLAEQGDTHAQYLIGQLYRDGPLLIPDSRRAKHWLTQAAEQNLLEAQYALGKLLLSDDWEVRDPEEGLRWLKEAAEHGNQWAAYRLGKEYLSGEFVPKDATEAVDWFTKSAEADNQYAQYMLGKLYLTGQGLPQDQAQAIAWFGRSAAQGNQYAQFFLEQRNNLRPPSVMLAVTRLLYHMSRIFENHALPHPSAGLHVDRKLRRKIQEKKIAMGHKPDDHEEEQSQCGMVMGGM